MRAAQTLSDIRFIGKLANPGSIEDQLVADRILRRRQVSTIGDPTQLILGMKPIA